MAGMSKTPEEIKIGLECCEKFLNGAPEEECCHVCNYANNCAQMKPDALALIRQLEAENAELLEKIKQLERERDAAIYDLKKARECRSCKHIDVKPSEQPCRSCGIRGRNYEWRGLCKENEEITK